MRQKILLVDREAEVTNPIGASLRTQGYQVSAAWSGANALAVAKDWLPEVVVLDVLLPDISGFELCRQLQAQRAPRHVAVIFLTTQATEEDRIRGFEIGADDFITKPSSVREVVLRVKKSLERATALPESPANQKMAFGALVLDSFRHEVTLDREIIPLTPIEFQILEMLMKHQDGALDRKAIHREIWPWMTNSYSRTMDAHIKRLRRKLGPMGRAIETITGFGYRLKEGLAAPPQVVDPMQSKLNELVFAINRINRGKTAVPGLKKKLNALLALK